MGDADDDGQAAPPDPAATPQASAADAPAPDPASATSPPAEPNQSVADAPVAAEVPPPALDPVPVDSPPPAPTQSAADTPALVDVPTPAPVSDPAPVDSAAPEQSQSAANTPAPPEPNVCIEPSQSDPAISGTPSDGGSQTDGASSPDAPIASANGAVPGADAAQGETSLADSGAQPSGTGNAAQLTDLHYDWLKRLHGSDVREAVTEPGGAPSASPAANELSFIDKAKVALQVAGEVTGVSGVVRTVEQKASAAVDTAKQVGSIVAEHPGEAVAGLAYGAVQGFTPGGVVAPSPDPKSKAFELARGVGMMAGGVGAAVVGVGEEVVGVAADLTGIGAPVGVLLNVGGVVSAATAVTSELAGAATIANAMSMEGDGSSSSSTGGDKPAGMPSASAQAQDRQRIASIRDGNNNIKGHLQESDLNAARRELNGEVVKRKADGTPWDHVHEVIDAQTGLYKRINDLKGVMTKYPTNSPEYAEMQELLSDMSRTLDKSREFVPTGSAPALHPEVVSP